MIRKISDNEKGFTLVELLVAVSIFVVVAVFSMGAVISVFDANKKSQSTKTVVDNLNLSIENVARTVRFGSSYHCGSSGSFSSPQNCSSGDSLLAVTFNGSVLVYRLNGTTIQKSTNGGLSYTNITSPDTVVQYLSFYVFGSSTSDTVQPYVVAVIKGYVGTKPTTQSIFSIETVMSQRTLDI